ncbi:MAG TPA: class I tRNA ligase family protein, partial [Gemmatimonadaceae bacterium]|nr:class I tRNA ligase family protein [Gemmatimonadaceae bacterium]
RSGQARHVSRQNFIELCNRLTVQDEEQFKDLWTRLGLSVDWRQEYATIDAKSRRISQMSFYDLLDKGHVYQSTSPIMWDTGFQTAVAQAEVEDRT